MFHDSVAWRLCIASLVAPACVAPNARTRLAAIEHRAKDDDELTASLAARIDRFERDVDEILDLYRRADDELEAATLRFERARGASGDAADDYAQAARDYEAAAENWRLVTVAIIAAATWDYAGHLCGTRLTTAQYRRQLREEGLDLSGLDADHGLPRSLGGADHPLNYEMIDSSLNRSLGNRVLQKLVAHPTHVLRGAAVSALMRLRCSPQL